jgi:ABC-type nitrate/sulfonate/bicarbonate transport system substrate-binding protein
MSLARASTLTFAMLSLWLLSHTQSTGMSPAQAAEIKIGFATGDSVDYAPAFAAEQRDMFKKAGLDVKLIAFRGGAAAQEALTAGSVDIITYFGPAVGLAVSKGTHEKMVATIAAGNYGWNMIVPKESGLTSTKDLDGKTIGISSKASTSDMAALWVADTAHVSIKQIPLGAGALIPALRSKQVDAIIFSALLTMREVLDGRARSLIDVGTAMPKTMADVYVASEEMMTKRPAELKAVLAVIYESLAYMKANRAWTLNFLKDFAKSDNEAVTNALYDLIIPQLSADGHIEEKWVQDGLDLAARAWEQPELTSIKASTLFSNDFCPPQK